MPGAGGGGQISGSVTSNDTNADDDAIIITNVGIASNGTASFNGGLVYYNLSSGKASIRLLLN